MVHGFLFNQWAAHGSPNRYRFPSSTMVSFLSRGGDSVKICRFPGILYHRNVRKPPATVDLLLYIIQQAINMRTSFFQVRFDMIGKLVLGGQQHI